MTNDTHFIRVPICSMCKKQAVYLLVQESAATDARTPAATLSSAGSLWFCANCREDFIDYYPYLFIKQVA